ncbi:MAG: hypothetical protein M0Z38_10080 [Deltaproteobacteria bacterium]|nr:hypothetical protein [Deltaproteobacteria bacterium]
MKEMKGPGPGENHRVTMMGDRIFGGKVGPWQCEARLTDMKTHMEKTKASGMKTEGVGRKSHHVAVYLTDPGTKQPFAIANGKGTVTVTGPDKNSEKYDFMVAEGHFGSGVNLSKTGKYTFRTEIESGDKKGSASFSYTVKQGTQQFAEGTGNAGTNSRRGTIHGIAMQRWHPDSLRKKGGSPRPSSPFPRHRTRPLRNRGWFRSAHARGRDGWRFSRHKRGTSVSWARALPLDQ